MQKLVLRETKKEHEGEDFYGTVVPEPPVENVLPVAAYDVLLRIESSCIFFIYEYQKSKSVFVLLEERPDATLIHYFSTSMSHYPSHTRSWYSSDSPFYGDSVNFTQTQHGFVDSYPKDDSRGTAVGNTETQDYVSSSSGEE